MHSVLTLRILLLMLVGIFACTSGAHSAAEEVRARGPFAEANSLAIVDNKALTRYVYFFGKSTSPIIATLGAHVRLEE